MDTQQQDPVLDLTPDPDSYIYMDPDPDIDT